jgi:hypothetical protein
MRADEWFVSTMTGIACAPRLRRKKFFPAAIAAGFLLSAICALAAPAPQPQLAAKWSRFEQSFKSSAIYANPPEEAELAAEFISPLGETNKVSGFWDGGQIWRVRFSPDLPGKWTFRSICSDATNAGLNRITGEFLCTAAAGKTQFERHGPIRVARDRRHLEYTDQTPFLWLGDAAWEGALRSRPKDWNDYAQLRASQKFTALQFIASPGVNSRNQSAFADDDHTLINPEYFRELDLRLEILDRAGLLSAIAPIWDIAARGVNDFDSLTDEQIVKLLRHMLARWGANNVVWILTAEGNSVGGRAQRWKRIGRQIFGGQPHAPVIIFPGGTFWTLDDFRAEPWVDVLSYQSGQDGTDDSLQWMLVGPISTDWKRPPFHPFINLGTPYESLIEGQPEDPLAPQTIRRAVCWSLLNSPPAGVSYGAVGVWNGLGDAQKNSGAGISAASSAWQRAAQFPAAQQLANIADFFASIDFWQLRPAPDLVANQPGLKSPKLYIAAARTESQDLAVVYVPEDRNVDLNPAGLPASPSATWINPRTGERTPAPATVRGASCRYSTPDPGDWLLLIKAAK